MLRSHYGNVRPDLDADNPNPNVFNSSGHILAERPNMERSAASRIGDDMRVHDLIYRKSYLLHGDLGARAKGGRYPHKTGDKAETYTVKGEQLLWGLASGVSLYPVTTRQDRYVPDIFSVATT